MENPTPTTEALVAELTLCCLNAKAAYEQHYTLERSRSVQLYWNLRARATFELLPRDAYSDVEEAVGWDSRVGYDSRPIKT